MISAKIIKHSVYNSQELISIETNAPKFLDAEIEKHRMISSNSSSDRAIPLDKMIKANYFLPIDVRLNQKGMQGYVRASHNEIIALNTALAKLRNKTCNVLKKFDFIHKQHLNRYLMPFSFQKKIMTANKDQWDYFLSLRLHAEADPAIYELSYEIDKAIRTSKPQELRVNEWHLPYILDNEFEHHTIETLCEISSARCARTSYNNKDNVTPTLEEDLRLFDFLINESLPHATPTEHQATPMDAGYSLDQDGISHIDKYGKLWSGNFHSFVQFRKILEDNSWNVENNSF